MKNLIELLTMKPDKYKAYKHHFKFTLQNYVYLNIDCFQIMESL